MLLLPSLNYAHRNSPHRHFATESIMMREYLEPFQTFWQLFNFRTTASYYLCHFALNKDPFLSQFGSPNSNSFLHDELKYYEPMLREDAKFQSALVSFCPDRCCGEALFKENSSVKRRLRVRGWVEHCLSHASNPCSTFGNGTCRLSLEENQNFDALKRNQINYTCSCDSGYRYSVELMICVDIDECEVGGHSCTSNGQTCLNTPGSFFCQCEFNFRALKDDESSCLQDPYKEIGDLDQFVDNIIRVKSD